MPRIGPTIDYQGDSPKVEPDHMWRSVTLKNSSGADIAANMAVFIDETVSTDFLGGHITIATAGALGADAGKFIGVTKEAIPDGEIGEVVTAGLVMCEVAAGVAADDLLTIDNVTDGHLETSAGVGTDLAVAVALEAISATVTGQALVRVFPTL